MEVALLESQWVQPIPRQVSIAGESSKLAIDGM